MTDINYLHTWELKRDGLLMKYYTLLYPAADVNKANFCKLWWAVVCGPLMALVWLLVGVTYPIWRPFLALVNRLDKKIEEREEAETKKKESKAKQVALKVPAFFARLADRIAAFFQAHPLLSKVLGISVLVVLAAVVLGFVGYIVALLVLYSTGIGWAIFGLILAAVAVIVIIVSALYYLTHSSVGEAVGDFLEAGYVAVKSRTCPKVVLK